MVKDIGKPRDAKGAGTEDQILQAARKLFEEKGFKGATTTLIAAEAGVTHAMLHYYFRTKEQLFIKVLGSKVAILLEEMRAVMSRSGDVYLTTVDVVDNFFDFVIRNKSSISLLMEVASDQPELLQTYLAGIREMTGPEVATHEERFRKAVSEGKIAPVSFREIVADLLSMVWSAVVFEPFIRNVMGKNDLEVSAYYDSRKREIRLLIESRLRK